MIVLEEWIVGCLKVSVQVNSLRHVFCASEVSGVGHLSCDLVIAGRVLGANKALVLGLL